MRLLLLCIILGLLVAGIVALKAPSEETSVVRSSNVRTELDRNWIKLPPKPSTTTTTHVRLVPSTTTTAVARSAPSERESNSSQVQFTIRRAFARFGAEVAEEAVRVSGCETGGTWNPAARNGAHAGLFQLSRTYHEDRARRLGFTWEQMFQVEPNIAVAVDIYRESGWTPWTCRTAA